MLFNLVKKSKFRKLVVAVFLGLTTTCAFADLDDARDLGAPPPPSAKGKPAAKPQSTPDLTPNLGAPGAPPPSTPPIPKADDAAPKKGAKADKKNSKNKNPVTTNDDKHDSKLPITWTANGLRGSKSSKIVDLLDAVVVTQGNLKLEADSAKVFMNEQDEVTKVEAQGARGKECGRTRKCLGIVKVTKAADVPQDRISAQGNEALFDNLKRTVTLTGRAALWRGGDVVRGKQITYNLDTGWITVDSVEGVVQPGDQQKP